jgi:serine/threonine protein kinase
MQHIFNIRSSDLEIIQKLGEGSYGAVYLGRFHKAHVAIKKLAASMMSSNVSDFFREASLMLSIPPHKNVVRVYGSSSKTLIFVDNQ